MKLHLPKNLRSALLSAVLAFTAATPSFAAVTPWAIENWTGYDTTSQSVTVGSSNVVDVDFLNQTWNTNWSIVVSADVTSLTGTLNLLGVKWETAPSNPDFDEALAEGVAMKDEVLKLSVWNGTNNPLTQSVDFSSLENNIIFVVSRNGSSTNNLTLKVYDSANVNTPIYTLTGNRNQSSGGNLAGVVFGGKGDYSTKESVFFEENAGSYRITKVGYSLGSIATADDLTAFNNVLSWDGGGGNNWSDASWAKNGETGQTLTGNDSVVFAKDNASVTIGTATSVAAATIGKDTTFNLGSSNLSVTNLTLEGGKTLTVSGSGELRVNTLGTYVGNSAGTVDAEKGTSVILTGTQIADTTVKGTLKLVGSGRVTLKGAVTLDSVVNNLTTANNENFTFVGLDGDHPVTLTFTGTSDLTNGRTNKASGIALRDGTITVGKGDGTEATLTTAAIQITTGEAANYNASVVVNGGGTLNLVKVASNDTAHTFVDTLTNHGTVRAVTTNETDEVVAKKNIHVYANVTNDGSLKAGTLKIRNATPQDVKTLTSELGGTVEVDTLTLVGGTTDITGAVTSGRVEANSATVTLSGSGGTLTIGSAAAGGTLTARANSGNGTVKNATIAANSIAGANAQTLGELVSLNVEFAAAVNVSNVTMSNVVLKAAPDTNGTVTYTNAKAVATTMGGAAAPALYAATLSDTPDTLTAMAVQEGGIASGTLIIDVTKDLIAAHYGRSLEWKFLDQVTLGADFKIALGDVLMEMVNDGLPEVWLTVDNGESIQLTTANVNKITTDAAAGGLLAGTTSPVDVTLTVKNIPEPTTATLSLLALAALAARRRRKK